MKKSIVTLGTLLFSFGLAAHAATKYECKGNHNDTPLEITFFEGGYGYDATYAYLEDGKEVSSGYAHGMAFTECGTRTNPCGLITSVSYSVEKPDMNFLMLTSAGAKKGKGSLSVYGEGFGKDKTAEIELSCEVKHF